MQQTSNNVDYKSVLLSHNEKQDKYEFQILPKHTAPGNIGEYEDYFTYDTDDLKSLTIDECSQICVRLVQYALYIQRCYNRDQSRIHFLKSEIKKCIASKVQQYTGQWEFQREQAIQNDEYARSLNDQLIELEQRSVRLDHLSVSIKNLADQYKSLQFAKINDRKHTPTEII